MSTQLTTYQPTPILSDVLDRKSVIPAGTLIYFRGRLSNRVHELVLSEFAKQEQANKTSRAELARKIGRKPEQITRWLGSPGNWTLDTISDLLLGMGLELGLSIQSLSGEQTISVTSPAVYSTVNSGSSANVPWLIYDYLQDCHVDPQLYGLNSPLLKRADIAIATSAPTSL